MLRSCDEVLQRGESLQAAAGSRRLPRNSEQTELPSLSIRRRRHRAEDLSRQSVTFQKVVHAAMQLPADLTYVQQCKQKKGGGGLFASAAVAAASLVSRAAKGRSSGAVGSSQGEPDPADDEGQEGVWWRDADMDGAGPDMLEAGPAGGEGGGEPLGDPSSRSASGSDSDGTDQEGDDDEGTHAVACKPAIHSGCSLDLPDSVKNFEESKEGGGRRYGRGATTLKGRSAQVCSRACAVSVASLGITVFWSCIEDACGQTGSGGRHVQVSRSEARVVVVWTAAFGLLSVHLLFSSLGGSLLDVGSALSLWSPLSVELQINQSDKVERTLSMLHG